MIKLLDRLKEWKLKRQWHRDLDSMNLKFAVEYNRLILIEAQRKQKILKLYERIHKRKGKNSHVV